MKNVKSWILLVVIVFMTPFTSQTKLAKIDPSYVSSEGGAFLTAGKYTVKFENCQDFNHWIVIAASFSQYEAEKRYSYLLIFRTGMMFSHLPTNYFAMYRSVILKIAQTDPEPVIRQEAIKLYGVLGQEPDDLFKIADVYNKDNDPEVKKTALEAFIRLKQKLNSAAH